MGALAAPEDDAEFRDWLFTLPAFYAEFAPLPQHSSVVDHLYVLKDCGTLTARRRVFASPFREVSFTFRRSAETSDHVPKVVVVQPSFGHRKRNRAFHGWVFGVRSRPSLRWLSTTDRPPFAACQTRLAQAVGSEPSCTDVLSILDCLLHDLTQQSAYRSGEVYNLLAVSPSQVARLATLLDQSVRTLQRRMRTSTGLSPKRFLAVERFHRAVHEVPTRNAKLSLLASDLGFSDQAHLTREFQRHAGLSPGAFQQVFRGQAVRFVQDSSSPTRLRVAVWAPEDHR